MPRLICTSRYIKNSKSKNAGNLIKYMGTREGAEKLSNGYDNSPATQKQHSLICDLLSAYPPIWEYPEFQKYTDERSKGAATECINAVIERNADQVQDVKKLVSYMAERPGVEKLGKHGLFSQTDDKINLDKVCDEVANHEGTIWTHVVSLTREDAERLGYNKAAAWRELVRRNAMQIAEAHKIPISEMKWYAAFHNTTHHPHIHLVVYSENIKHGYLTKKGIDSLHSIFANDIFRNEMYHLFTLQTQMRNEVKAAANQKIEELLQHSSESDPSNENMFFLISQLVEQLKKHKGKKLYGYLQKDIKNTVDAIVRELAKDKRILPVGETKTETGKREILLPPSTVELLKKRKENAVGDWIFPNWNNPEEPMNPQSAYSRLKVLLKKAGLPLIRFHDLRHTFATHAIAGGVDAKTLSGILGHTNASFTLDTYTHVTTDMQKNAARIVGNFMDDIIGGMKLG